MQTEHIRCVMGYLYEKSRPEFQRKPDKKNQNQNHTEKFHQKGIISLEMSFTC